jgi:hypothetical protein
LSALEPKIANSVAAKRTGSAWLCRMNTGLCWASSHRYTILVSLLLLQVTAFSLQGIWVEDFWEHSAAVSEFMRHPFDPSHPQLNLAEAHTFLNPYAFVVALTASLFNIDAITTLSLFGVINFCIFCIGLYAFTSSLCKEHKQILAFYSLLLILFLWGAKPWPYSGFFSYQIFLFNLPYPSTLVGGISLLTLGLTANKQTDFSLLQWIGLALVTTLCLLTHPLTAQFLVIGLVAQAFFVCVNTISRLLKITLLCIGAVVLASLWPFYPFLELLRGAGTVYDISNGDMYFHFMERIWPFLMLSPVIIWVLSSKQHRVLLFMFLATILVYLFGYLTQKYSYGRIISYTLVIAQICCAIALVRLEIGLKKISPNGLNVYRTLLLLGLVFLSTEWLHASANRLLTAANSVRLGRPVFNQVSFQEYGFLPQQIQPKATVFANIEASWLLPSFGAKVIAADHPLAFIKDAEQRRQDCLRFFIKDTPLAERQQLLKKYGANYLLLDKKLDPGWHDIYKNFTSAANGSLRFENDRFALIALPEFK